MKPDKNEIIYWDLKTTPMGCGFWPVLMGHLTSYGQSHYVFPLANYYCPHIILKGRGVVRFGGQDHPIGPGDMFSIWSGESIEYFDDSENPWEYLWIHLAGDGTESYLNGCGFSSDNLVLRPGDVAKVKQLFWQIRTLYIRRDYRDIPLILSRFYDLGAACGHCDSVAESLPQRDIVHEAVVYIEAMLNTPLDITHIAASLGVCRTTLYRAFIKDKGITPIEYLSSRRIERARELLKTTDLNIAEISRMVGFSEQRYFIRCFRERTGQTPGVFRNHA